MTARNIYLTGFSGSGKSTIARLLSTHLACPAYDLDQLIVEQAGMSIPAIFAQEGEAGFRERESAALRDVAGRAPCVVATGGGAPLRAENRALMAESGWVVVLEARPETLHERMLAQRAAADPAAARPLMDSASPLEHIRALKERRQPIYALADWTVHTDRLSQAQITAEIVRALAILEGRA